jgi:hypothetical protein
MKRAKPSPMSADSEVERIRERLSRMTDAEVLQFGDAARMLCEGTICEPLSRLSMRSSSWRCSRF